MKLNLDFRPYRRPFRSPLKTAHGLWSEREGIILKLTMDNGWEGWGEIAPLPWFGTETWAEAHQYLLGLDGAIASQDLWAVNDKLPCCQFALGSAWWMLEAQKEGLSIEEFRQFPPFSLDPQQVAGLLPAGAAALERWDVLYAQGHRTLKWKLTGDRQDLAIFGRLLDQLPPDVTLRLDANGSLSRSQAESWLEQCEFLLPDRIEFLEQPLDPQDFDNLLHLSQSQRFATPIALDESVATGPQLQDVAQAGWSDGVVIKAAIAGYPQFFLESGVNPSAPAKLDAELQPWLSQFSAVVMSSVFETPVGQWAALRLAEMLGKTLGDRPLGFGTDAWLAPLHPHWLDRLWAGDQPFETVRSNSLK